MRSIGWYPDPERPGMMRHWDGDRWGARASREEIREIAETPSDELEATPEGIRCGKCGGTQFKARRTGSQRARIVAVGVLSGGLGAAGSARRNEQKVQCITCGTFYPRLA